MAGVGGGVMIMLCCFDILSTMCAVETYPPDRLFLVILDGLDGEEREGGDELALGCLDRLSLRLARSLDRHTDWHTVTGRSKPSGPLLKALR